jgi:hypothetical protein
MKRIFRKMAAFVDYIWEELRLSESAFFGSILAGYGLLRRSGPREEWARNGLLL